MYYFANLQYIHQITLQIKLALFDDEDKTSGAYKSHLHPVQPNCIANKSVLHILYKSCGCSPQSSQFQPCIWDTIFYFLDQPPAIPVGIC